MRYLRMTVLVFLCFATIPLIASKENKRMIQNLRKELVRLQGQNDLAETAYWNKKKEFINRQERAAKEIKAHEKSHSGIIKDRNSLLEDRLKKEARIADLRQEIEQIQLYVDSINTSLLESLKQLEQFIRYYQPYTVMEELKEVNRLRNLIKVTPNDFIGNSTKVIALCLKMNAAGRTASLSYGSVLTQDSKLRQAWKLRIGNVFYAFVSSDHSKVGLLVRGGSGNRLQWLENIPDSIKSNIKKSVATIMSLKKDKKEAIVTLPFDLLFSKAVSRRYGRESGTLFEAILELFSKGGPIMFPLAFLALFGIVIIIERALFYHKNHSNGDALFLEISGHLDKKKIDTKTICAKLENKKGPLKRMITDLMDNIKADREQIYSIMQESILHEQPFLEKRLSLLKILAAIAPLLGLLGTVSGMISLFDTITLYGTKDPKLLAGGISEALITTQTGLIIAIPLILLHRLLLNRSNHLIEDMERYGLTIINKVWIEARGNKK